MMRETIIYGYNYKSIGISLILCPLSRIMVVGSHLLRVCDLSSHRFSIMIMVPTISCGASLKSIRKWLVTHKIRGSVL